MTNINNFSSSHVIDLKEGVEVAPGIFIYDEVIDNSNELINLAMSRPEKWKDSEVKYSHFDDQVVDKTVRNTRILHIPPTFSNDVEWFKVAQVIWHYADKYGTDHHAPFASMEHPQLLHYSTGSGFYKPHTDSMPGHLRIFSALLYLNDVEDGGETYFNKFDVAIKPKAGRLALFPATFSYSHEAKPPNSNEKFAIVTWFNPII